MSDLGEFDLIARQLAPLSAGFKGAFDLTDDAAMIAPPEGMSLIVTADTLVEGRHFPVDEDPALATRKALRTNLSDLAAMGAQPYAYLTSIVWPNEGRETRIEGFVSGLKQDQSEFGLPLIGGDTTASDGPWTLSITALGLVPHGQCLRRNGAEPGDELWITGTIGDAYLGLKHVQGDELALSGDDIAYLLNRLRLPEPRISLVPALRQYAKAGIDISDGLLADAHHVAQASGVRIKIDLDLMPLSAGASKYLEANPHARIDLATGGDDYELLLAIAPEHGAAFQAACEEQGIRTTKIGVCKSGPAGLVIAGNEISIDTKRFGFTHF